jgi:hypothetical protein
VAWYHDSARLYRHRRCFSGLLGLLGSCVGCLARPLHRLARLAHVELSPDWGEFDIGLLVGPTHHHHLAVQRQTGAGPGHVDHYERASKMLKSFDKFSKE